MKTTSFFVIALLIASVGVTSAANISFAHRYPVDTSACDTEWGILDNAGNLNYTCVGGIMTYTFTIVEPWNITANTDYSLVFYSHNGSGIWDPCVATMETWVGNNQDTTLINNGTTDANGDLSFSGTFDFSGHGQGLEYINDGVDYDGSVKGAKVWLVLSSGYNEEEKRVVWTWVDYLWETDLVTCTEAIRQTVSVFVPIPTVSFEVTPVSYVYGEVKRGQCSEDNPNGQITLNNTGTLDLQIMTITTGIFENIDYNDGSWVDGNDFVTEVDVGTQEGIDTRICIPLDAEYGVHTGMVTFEYIPILP